MIIDRIGNKLLDLIYPRRCMCCKNIFPFNENKYVCDDCLKIFKTPKDNTCIKCGRQLYENKEYNKTMCKFCVDFKNGKLSEDTTFYYVKNYPIFIYNDASKIPIFELKYGKKLQNLDGINVLIKNYLANIDLSFIDVVIPIPMNKKKLKKRGFNQAELIAKLVSDNIGKPYFNNIIIRNKNTSVQSNKSPKARYENLAHCFSVIKKESILNKNVLLIDDIFTSGSTINSSSKQLVLNGAKNVYSLTLSISDLAY